MTLSHQNYLQSPEWILRLSTLYFNSWKLSPIFKIIYSVDDSISFQDSANSSTPFLSYKSTGDQTLYLPVAHSILSEL